MAKGSPNKLTVKSKEKDTTDRLSEKRKKDYLFSMSMAPTINEATHWFQIVPIAIFTAIVIMITRMAVYTRPMNEFFWRDDTTQLNDFFSYYKMGAIVACAVLALVIIMYRIFTQSFYIKRNLVYIPMIIYTMLVVLSYLFSDYKLFALWGGVDRFEGTVALVGYMIMLFFIINSINNEKNIKWVIYPVAVSSALLGILGITQALDHDFFRTSVGKKLITPSWFWDQVDSLSFTFQNKEIYQTVYNINYVSFYLTLLIPLFGLLFIASFMEGKEGSLWKKLGWGALFALLIFNLIGSASSGGLMGMAVIVLVSLFVLNKKILMWWKPIVILFAISVIIAGFSYTRWLPELTSAIEGVTGTENKYQTSSEIASSGNAQLPSISKTRIDFIDTYETSIIVGVEGNNLAIMTFPDNPEYLNVVDGNSDQVEMELTEDGVTYKFTDERFDMITLRPTADASGNKYLILKFDAETEWPFVITEKGPMFINPFGKQVDLNKVPVYGFEENQRFGSGRGYIWSRTIPMIKDTILLGHGADTYSIYFPQGDYVGKYNEGWEFATVIDKPHNMYMGITIGTGLLSLISLIFIWGGYLVQSFLIYFKYDQLDFKYFCGVGIFLGVCGFLVSGIVNDSSVSTMPMFYGLLGIGIAINYMIKQSKSQLVR